MAHAHIFGFGSAEKRHPIYGEMSVLSDGSSLSSAVKFDEGQFWPKTLLQYFGVHEVN
jgi:hypothetical protein